MLRHVLLSAAVASLSLLSLAGNSQAAIIGPNSSAVPAAESDPSGGTIEASMSSAITAGTFSGTLVSTVLSNDPSNPWGPTALTFTYLLSNDSTSIDSINRLTLPNFTGIATDASYFAPTTGTIPAIVSRSSGAGDVVGFDFMVPPFGTGQITPGASSALLVVQTNFTTYALGTASVIDGTAETTSAFLPGGAGSTVPEPATLTLAASAATLLLLRKRR